MCLLCVSIRWWIITFRSPKSPKTPILGARISISSQICEKNSNSYLQITIRLTWNLTSSSGQQQTSWVVSCGGKIISRWWTAAILKIDISPYLSKKSSDFDEILNKAADFELDERHVIKNEKVALDRLRVRQKSQNVFLVLVKISCCSFFTISSE